ncbi:hypothetical protein BGZ49_010656 [Haplosporangium sp. Z 27]|nr:hypothetical protein BGZ49_010656 [Haplosporangium sp. Z 27]
MLESLHISMSETTDQDLSQILYGKRIVQELKTLFEERGPFSLAALRRHFHNLQSLSTLIIDSNKLDPVISAMIHEVLASCPNLVHLDGFNLFAEDQLADSTPWIATNLSNLYITVEFPHECDPSLHIAVFKQLFQLRSLVYMRIGSLMKGYSLELKRLLAVFRVECSMLSENALDLPEIRSLIGSFISRPDILHCALVCKSWHSTFAPLLWRETTILSAYSQNWTFAASPPPRSLFHSHAHLIRSLAYVGGPISAEEISLGDNCYQLVHLRLTAAVSRSSTKANGRALNLSAQGTEWSWLDYQDTEDAKDTGNTSNDDSDDGIEDDVRSNRTWKDDLSGDKAWRRLAELVRRNQNTLRTLSIVLTSPPPSTIPTREFWENVAECFPSQSFTKSARMTGFHLSGREIKLEDLMLIWGAAMPYLRTAQFSKCLVEYEPWIQFVGSSDVIAGMGAEFRTASELRHLELQEIRGMDPETQFAVFIAKCPKLKTLEWSIHRSHVGTTWGLSSDIVHYLDPQSQHRRLELESLIIVSERETKAIPDRLLATLLEHTCSSILRTLTLKAISVGELTLHSLRSHFNHLHTLDLGLCSGVTSTYVQQILSSSPEIRRFTANVIHAQDIRTGDPWVCLKLESLSIFIDLSHSSFYSGSGGESAAQSDLETAQTSDNPSRPTTSDLCPHQVVFEQLSKLTCLEHLDLGRKHHLSSRGTHVETLHWRLGSGLGRLSTLTKLAGIYLSNSHTMNMSKNAVIWMINHFPKLERVQGRLGMRKSDHRDLEKLLRTHGIDCSLEIK